MHEHPLSAKSWALPSTQQLLNHPSVQVTQTHMCRSLMDNFIDHGECEKGLVKKPTGSMSSSRYIIQELDRKCTGYHGHIPLVGGRAAGAAIYPQALREAICRETARQKRMDRRDNMIVSTGKMNADQVKNFTNQLCSFQLRGPDIIKKIMSVQCKNVVTRPTGDHPENWNDEWHDDDDGGNDWR